MDTKTTSFPTLSRLSEHFSISFLYTGDFDGNGLEDIIVAGRPTASPSFVEHPEDYPRYQINLITQHPGGVFRLATDALLAPGEDLIYGSEPAIVIKDFNADGVDDFFLGGGTDTDYRVPSFFYLSQPGGGFARQTIPTNKWIHGVAAWDVDKDGRAEIFTTGYDQTHHYIKYDNGQLIIRDQLSSNGEPSLWGTSALVVGDFLGNGGVQAVRTDDGGEIGTRLYELALDKAGHIRFTPIGTLPPGRFELPKWAHLDVMPDSGFRSHEVKIYARDLDDDGRDDLVILSWPWMDGQGQWPAFSEVQLLMNKGEGRFADETEQRLVGFDTTLAPSHYLRFVDVNGDGHDDIYLDAHAFDSPYSKRILLNDGLGVFYQADNGPLALWAEELNAERNSEWAADAKSTPMTIVRGENGATYLAALLYPEDGGETGWRHTYEASLYTRPLTPDLYPSEVFPGGAPGLRTDVLDLKPSAVRAYWYEHGILKVIGDASSWTLYAPARVRLEDALYAFDTHAPSDNAPAGAVWQVAALHQAAFGLRPDSNTMSRWVAEADRLQSIDKLAQALIDHHAPGITTADLVMHLYNSLTGTAASVAEIAYFLDSVGPDKAFETQGALFAYAANLPLNTENLAGIVGGIHALDPVWF